MPHFPRGTRTIVMARGTLDRKLAAIDEEVGIGIEDAAQEVLETARVLAPKATGELADTLYLSKLWKTANGWRIEIVAPAPHAAAQERGSGLLAEARPGIVRAPIVIRPTGGRKVLSFWWKNAPARLLRGHTFEVFLPWVSQIGVPPTRFLRRALKEHTTRTYSRILEAIKRGVNE